MRNRYVIFDLDGTLIDPSKAICRSINYALRKKGHEEVDHEKLYPYIGRHLIDPFRDLTGIEDESYLWEMIKHYRDRYESVGIVENSLYPGIEEMIRSIDSINYIASIKPGHACKMVLEQLGIGRYFSGFYGSEVDGTRADKTELLHYIKDVEDLTHAVMVGDRDTDILAAKSCGFASIGVCYGYGSHAELKDAKPDLLVNRPESLKKAIETLWKN